MPDDLKQNIVTAAKWSSVAEVAAKLLTPVISMVLARLLAPEAFGVVASLVIIISFAEVFADAGFQKYLIQHEFGSESDLYSSSNVAFWSNLCLSFFLWTLIFLFRDPLAACVGSPDMGTVLAVASLSIPLASFSSIQTALYKRALDFKTLFHARIVYVLVPLLVTLPLALFLKNYWALVIGTLSQNMVNALLLTCWSKWKPRLYFSFRELKEMLSFSLWSLFESISIWLTSYVDVFIVGTMLSQYYLGLYRTSSILVGQVFGLVTSVTTPILFSSLSRLQNNRSVFLDLFYKFQKTVALVAFPIGIILFSYDELVTKVLLGESWMEASFFIGLWGLSSALMIVLSHYCSEIYRALGKPKLSVLAQWLHIIVLWPAVWFSVRYGFHTLCWVRSSVRLEFIVVHLLIVWVVLRISPLKMTRNIVPALFAAALMFGMTYLLRCVGSSVTVQIGSLCVSLLVYVGCVMMFPKERILFFDLAKLVRR
ncbi:MAG: lipopolysaccharide biosynthesis protein [Paludibacteraceae bacterium]|nr:lipopolysaccharide biosynthesis protein [Paludibacteraceae bacterium]